MKPKCLKCKKKIAGVAIQWYNDTACVDCYNEAVHEGIIKPLPTKK